MKDHARIKRPDNLSESEILGALASRNIPAEDVTINEKDIEILYPYHPAGGARNHEFEMVIQAISAAKPKTDETALRQRIAELENAVEKALAALRGLGSEKGSSDVPLAQAYLKEVRRPSE